MNKLKVVTVVGTRPEIIRLSCLIPKLDTATEHLLVHTGQNSDPNLKDIFFTDLELREPDVYLNAAGDSPGETMGNVLIRSEEVFTSFSPDAVMILGDTNSAVAALSAERLHVPVYHMEAGNRSFDANVPEELNRKMVDHISTFNLPYNSHSRRNLITEGIPPRFICATGSPMNEVLERFRPKIESSRALENMGLDRDDYILVSMHRQENVDSPDRLSTLLQSLAAVSEHLGLPVLVSTHPRTRAMLAKHSLDIPSSVNLLQPFGFIDYCKLQQNARIVLSDSGTISEESALLGFPAVTLRNSMERPEAIEAATIVLAGLEADSILNAVDYTLTRIRPDVASPEGYDVENFSDRVMAFLFSTAHHAKIWKGLH